MMFAVHLHLLCCASGRLFVLVMMLVGVVLIPVRASQLYSRLSERYVQLGTG